MKTVTLARLRKGGACSGAIRIFQGRFGDKALVEDIIDFLHKLGRDSWEGWLLAQDYRLTVSMLAKGANIHAAHDFALFWAARCGRTRIIQLLLEKGANIHVYHDDALRWAAVGGHLKIVKLLAENGANVHANNDVALHQAEHCGHTGVARFLREYSQAG